MEKQRYESPVIAKVNAGVPDKFGMRSRVKEMPDVDGIPVKDIIAQYGSPVYIISEKTVRNTYQEAYRAFSTRYQKVQFAWSYKTNYLDSICRIYHQEGSWAEVVSGFEYQKAILNGVPGKKIIFNGPDKSRSDLELAVTNGSYIHIDHFDELYLLIDVTRKIGKKAKVAIRVNMDTGIYPMWDRFGFNYENGEAWSAINRIMMQDTLDFVGLHTHIGTYILAPWAYATAATKLCELAVATANKHNHYISYIDMGGGFASKNTLKGAYLPGTDTCPTFDQYAEAITDAIINSAIDVHHLPTLILETGRALIDDAGYLAGTVKAIKRLSDRRKAMILDIGINNLFTSFWYNHTLYPCKINSQVIEPTTLYGPLCMNIDVIRESIQFPLLNPGDHVIIERIGAYNMTQWLQFINFRPNVVLIDVNKDIHIIRKAENMDVFLASEMVPKMLK